MLNDATRKKIAETLERDPGLSYRQVAKAYSVDVSSVYRIASKRPELIAVRRDRQRGARRASGDWQLAGGGSGGI